ncbi:RAI1 like PD-XK nuclease-domain-containing protein [Lipomyces oligophaga]|uniref:RAI1 like PD-XK nuclease-domain-containing protein n=1 Tax=Lipomyces oligophaga TaxID=45792 RepID=UPI0034CD2EF2
MRAPREMISYSIDSHQETLVDNTSSLSYFYLRQEELRGRNGNGLDLSEGFNRFIRGSEELDKHIDALLLALIEAERRAGSKKCRGDIIAYRGMMTKLLTVPYDQQDGFEMNVMRFDGQIFIEENKQYKLDTRLPMTARQELMTFWGYKFEKLATLPKPWSECTRSQIQDRGRSQVSNIEQYCSLVRTGIGSTRLVMAGEVDCVRDYLPSKTDISPSTVPFDNPLDHYLELKTNKLISSDRDAVYFEKKLYRIWAQSFLLGVPSVVVGFRTDAGYIQSFEDFHVQKIPARIKQSKLYNPRTSWDAADSIDFFAAVLEWIKSVVPSDDWTPDQILNSSQGNHGELPSIYRIRYMERSDSLLILKAPATQKPFLLPEFVSWRASLHSTSSQ